MTIQGVCSMRLCRRIRISGFLIAMSLAQTVSGQDYNFSQFWENRTYYNPALTGLQEGTINGLATYRKLWPKFPGNFSTVHVAADLKTYNNYGFGLYIISSDEGGGFIKSNSFALSYSWRGYISKERNIYFQLGIQGSYNDQRLDFNKYIYSGNLHEIYGNVISIIAPEAVNEKENYWDFATGAMIYLPWERHYREFMHNYIGFSISHFTRPKNNFLENNTRIPIKLGLQWQSYIRTSIYSLDRKSSMYICPGLLFENKGENIMSSSSFSNFVAGTDITTDPVYGGVWYSSQLLNSSKDNYKAIIFKLGLKLTSSNKRLEYRLGYSYDMSLGNLVKTTEGSHEISFNIVYRFNAKYKYNIFSF